jgi:hypothetical protein
MRPGGSRTEIGSEMFTPRLLTTSLLLALLIAAVPAYCEGEGVCCAGPMMPAADSPAFTCCAPEGCVVVRPDTPQAAPSARPLPTAFPATAARVAPPVLRIPVPARLSRAIPHGSVPLPILHAQLLI